MSRRAALWICFSCVLSFPGALQSVEIPQDPLLRESRRIKSESESRIQKDILDWILGPNAAKAFVAVKTRKRRGASNSAAPVLFMDVTIVHDDRILDPVKDASSVIMIRKLVVEAMAQYELAPKQIFFMPVHFNRRKLDSRETFEIPKVYL